VNATTIITTLTIRVTVTIRKHHISMMIITIIAEEVN
jgi:hypothetical protein